MEEINRLNRTLRSFRDVTGHVGRKRATRHLRLEADNQPDEVTDVQYCVTGLPRDITRDEKLARLSELAETITNIENSDVFVISMWIGG
jgi:hypothetical protein